MVEIRRLYVFLALFTFVYFVENIGGTYMITAVQNIERHFQIPSKLSGFLVSAHDISYCLLVIQISYYGSKGNRAKWIGFGTITMAIAHIIISSPNFLFPTTAPQLNTTHVEDQLRPSGALLSPKQRNISAYFDYAPLRDRLAPHIREIVRSIHEHPTEFNSNLAGASLALSRFKNANYTGKNRYSLDEPLILEIYSRSDQLIVASNKEEREKASAKLLGSLRLFVANRQEFPEADLQTMRRAAVAPFAICHKLVNQMREILNKIKCHHNSSNMGPLFLIFAAMLVLGFGRTMPWPLGVPLIDDNVKKHQMPIWFAIINFFKILGPIVGFLIGSVVNKYYYTFPTSPPQGLSPQDPTWIGAWWLGFLFIGLVMIGPSFALFFFPESSKKNNQQHHRQQQLNGKVASIQTAPPKGENGKQIVCNGNGVVPKERRKLALFDRHMDKSDTNENGSKNGFREFLGSYQTILNSRVYVGASIARVIDIFALKGYMVFLPKYLENHYGIPQYRVHIYMALFGVLGFAFGVICGGVITRKLRLNGRKAATFVLVISLINTALFGLKSFLGCHSVVNMVGREGSLTEFNYTRQCNSQCACESVKLYPVCDAQGQAFYSPCHAGCRHVKVIDLDKYQLEFSECDCVSDGGIVSKDLCHDNCELMKYTFFSTVIIGTFIAGTAMVPGMLLLLRSVPPQIRSPALGLQGFLVSLIGTLPSPIIWGWLVDSACQVWDKDCHGQGACQIYDPWALRMRMHWLYVAIRICSLVADIYVCWHAKGLNLQEEEEEGEGGDQIDEKLQRAQQETFTLETISS